MIECKDSLEFLKTIEEYGNDIIYCDPPYALGSEVIIRKDGKVDYAKASDFMNKWEMPTGSYWEKWFIEAYRTLKHGGYLIMFGMDRQLLLFKYYAHLAGFVEQQSLYWYFISNFPKATDLSKAIEKNAGVEVKQGVGFRTAGHDGRPVMGDPTPIGKARDEMRHEAQTELGKKYDGYKYSISPLKQTNETIMVFQKPCKTGSPLHDTLAYENGDKTISVSALNIDGNRVGIREEPQFVGGKKPKSESGANCYGDYNYEGGQQLPDGRYPAQTFIDSSVAERLDLQSGELSGGVGRANRSDIGGGNIAFENIGIITETETKDYGGCSKILHKCDYTEEDYDLYFYEPKVSSSERNAGCSNIEETETLTGLDVRGRTLERDDGSKTLVDRFVKQPQQNNHPTLKPIALNEKILKLFKTPNDQRICYAFAGAGSEIIGGIKAGFDNWCGCEISQEYVDIANARIEYWRNEMSTQTTIFDFLD